MFQKGILTSVLLSILAVGSANALNVVYVNDLEEETKEKSTMTFYTNPLGLLVGVGNAGFEFREINLLGFTPSLYAGILDKKISGDKVSGYGVGLSGRYYSNQYELKGYFLELGYIFGSVDVETTGDKGSATYHFPEFMVGYRANAGRIIFEGGIGIGYFYSKVKSDITGEKWTSKGTVPILNLGIGFMF